MRNLGRHSRAIVVGVILVATMVSPAEAQSRAERSVVAIVSENGVNVLHQEFRTLDKKDVPLPAGLKNVVRVTLPFDRPFEEQVAAVNRSPLHAMKPGTTYYVRRTRLLVHTVDDSNSDVAVDAGHGTGTASAAGGRTTGAAPNSLIVVVVGLEQPSWKWIAGQSFIDVAIQTMYSLTGLVCDSAAEVRTFRQRGGIPLLGAGNSALDSNLFSPGGSPFGVRVGAVNKDGSTAMPVTGPQPTVWSGRLYDVGGLFRNRIAMSRGTSSYMHGTGTSGAGPQVAGRAAAVLERVRTAVGDTGSGRRNGSLVVASKRPRTGPLADGRLSADELIGALLNAAKPAEAASPSRYYMEGYGWLNKDAVSTAVRILLGKQAMSNRAADDDAYEMVHTMRGVAYATNGC